jgi:signal transduction histidine kinase/PAS domain-containing protein/ActR/RegA family two-component response regulator
VASHGDEEQQLRSVAMQNAQSILLARQRAEEDLIQAKQALELKTEELAHSLAMMRATLESTTDGILAVDKDYKVTGFNEKFFEMWRIPREVMAAYEQPRLAEVVSEQFKDPRQYLARVTEIYDSSPPESYDLLELADGKVFERFSKIQIVNEQNVGRVWIFRDITERRRAEEALRDETRILELLNQTGTALAAKLNLQALVQSVTDAATQLSGAAFGAFFYATKSGEGDALMLYALSGASRDAFEKLGQPRATPLFGPIFKGDDPIRCDDVLKDPRYGKMGPDGGMPPGHLPVRSYLAVPVVSRSGEAIGGLVFGHADAGVFTERTERIIVGVAAQAAVAIDNARLYEAAQKAADEREMLLASERSARSEAERMSEIKDEFLATLSHELRTPLNAILGWSQMLQRVGSSGADLHKGLDTIERNARAQAKLIEDLLDMSRITSGKVRLDIQRVEPISFIEAAVETVRPAADAKGILLEILLDPTAGPISGDPNRLQQVVWNLLSNAIKFTPKDGKVRVLLERVNSHLEISVADTGIGIKPEFLAHIFERFRQADGSTTRRYGGLGLGLSIVRSLVEMHGGTVLANSPGEGGGATFTVQFPIMVARRNTLQEARLHPTAPAAISADFKAFDLSGLKVLVVDDEADARDLIKRVLEECGAEVLTAASAGKAILLVESERPHVLVSDIGMPDVDGFELLRRVRALGPAKGGKVPAIALTAFARSEDRMRVLHAGFLAHVSKPVGAAELVATVASVAGRAGQVPPV